MKKRDERIRDPIHNLIKFSYRDKTDNVLWDLIQTPEFQRLRRIRQLGFSDIVYPGATHTRLAHSIGVMQMARRMIAVLERNKVFGSGGDAPLWRRATLCAALLHDVGHGPLSHVFEEVAHSVGIIKTHEEWTLEIIENTGINSILRSYSKELLDAVISFFQKEAGYNAYTNVISSQLDADRLDFLMRDRYYTGIRFGEIDIEWLFDSLYIDEIPIELDGGVKNRTFICSYKGLPVLEEYIHAYSTMYSKVYFHKTTRSAQIMMIDILKAIFSDANFMNDTKKSLLLSAFFSKKRRATVADYVDLDDSAMHAVVHAARHRGNKKFSELCRRFINRDLYKCFEIPKRPQEEAQTSKINYLTQKLKQQRIPYRIDIVPEKGYKQFDVGAGLIRNILVYSPFDKEPRSVASLSPSVRQMAERSPVRFYFDTSADRDGAKRIWEKLG